MNVRHAMLLIAIISRCLFTPSGEALASACDKASTQSEMNICGGKETHGADAELTAIYQKLLAKVSPDGQAALRAAERAWINYRDKQCSFNSLGSAGGSVHDMVEAQCLTDLTNQQIKQLQQQLICGPGDLACGGQ
jgi:uncharacterized protein YecT (DUF1311 family)